MSDVENIGEILDRVREPAIWIRRNAAATTRSRLGGLPALPPGIDWPRQTVSGSPLHFLAQIDLAELPSTPLYGALGQQKSPGLPRSGVIYFFADLDEELLWGHADTGDLFASTRVLYGPEADIDRAAPQDMPEIGHGFGELTGFTETGLKIFPACAIEFFVIDTFAGAAAYFQGEGSREADRRTLASIERATGTSAPVLTRTTYNQSTKLPVAVTVWDDRGVAFGQIHIRRHQMLGAAINVQGGAEKARANGDVLLLQLDTDWGLHEQFMFCDMGMVQFWIKPDDLTFGRFEASWGTTEGG
jgi:uncharacterized protein YwqG